MKFFKLFFVIFLFLILACSTPNTEGTKETIIKEVSTSANTTGYKLLNKVVYPLSASLTMKEKIINEINKFSFGNKAYAGNGNGYISVGAAKKASDKIAGIFYFDISGNSNDPLYHNIWNTLDLSSKIGKKTCRVNMYIKVMAAESGGVDEYAKVKFRSPDAILEPKEVSQKYGDTVYRSVEITTDTNGCIQWMYTGNNAYDRKYDTAEPDYHDYESLTVYFMLYDSFQVDVE